MIEFDRVFDPARAEYLSKVSSVMETVAGVRYSEVQSEIHPGNEAYKDAYDRGVSPEDFVADAVRDFGFVTCSRQARDPEGMTYYEKDAAATYNRYKAALVGYAGSPQGASEGWVRGQDGVLFNETPDGVAVMRPASANMDGIRRIGFGIEHFAGATMDGTGTSMVSAGAAGDRYFALDIGEAVEAFRNDHVRSADRAYG